MTTGDIRKRLTVNEQQGEKIISIIRLLLAFIYLGSIPVISLIRNSEGYGFVPWYAHIFTSVFFVYSVFLFFYVRKIDKFRGSFKYICVILDMMIISGGIWVTCIYPETAPPITYLSAQALFYSVLILAGAFRYSTRCAVFSGIFAGLCYMIVIFVNRNALDVPYYAVFNTEMIDVGFPLYFELFRFAGLAITGIITGVASNRLLVLLNNVIESETAAAEVSAKTVEQTRSMTKTIRKSTDEIFHSSKNIFSTATNQAASVQEIESTIRNNAQIAVEIAEKTGSVAGIAAEMENNTVQGFDVLEHNIAQMEEIKNKNDGVTSGIIALGNEINSIREIIGTINTITDNTKVIAFNASLEAAGAGERGKRFSVVASEVNRLADDIAELTKKIRQKIEGIQRSSSSLIISSEESAEKINEGKKLIKELKEIFREIRSGAEITANQAQLITVSTQQQQKSTEQINTAIADIASGLNNFLQSTEVATASAEGLTRMIEELGILLNIEEID